MTATTRQPTNKDLLQTTKFLLAFTRLPGATFFCQSVNLPGISLSEVPRNTPFVDLYVPGEKLQYDTFNVTFLVDEDLQSWQQLHDWIRGMTFPVDFKEYRDLNKLSDTSVFRQGARLPVQYTDAILTVYTNKNNVNFRVSFKDVFPISLTGVQFNAADNAEYIVSADASFRFSYYDIERF